MVSAVYQTKATVPACRSGTGPGGRAAEGRFRFQDYGAFLKSPELVRLREQCVPLRSELASGAVRVSFLEFPPGRQRRARRRGQCAKRIGRGNGDGTPRDRRSPVLTTSSGSTRTSESDFGAPLPAPEGHIGRLDQHAQLIAIDIALFRRRTAASRQVIALAAEWLIFSAPGKRPLMASCTERRLRPVVASGPDDLRAMRLM